MNIAFIITPALILSLYAIWRLLSIRKHDRVLYAFCQLRREIMAYLRQKKDRIPEEDYYQLRHLLEVVNTDIHNYNSHKKSRFNIKYWVREAEGTFKSARAAEIKKIDNNAKIEGLYHGYGLALIKALLSYSPFLRSKISLAILIFLMRKFVGDRLKDLINHMEWLKREMDNNSLRSRLRLG